MHTTPQRLELVVGLPYERVIYLIALPAYTKPGPSCIFTKVCIAPNLLVHRLIMALPTRRSAPSHSTAANRPVVIHGPPDEETPLLGTPASKPGWRKNMRVDVNRDKADIVLLMCYIITGLLDSAAISTWGSFVSMQTGLFQLVPLITSYVTRRADMCLSREHRLHRARLGRTKRVAAVD
jgi:hypothetical protein